MSLARAARCCSLASSAWHSSPSLCCACRRPRASRWRTSCRAQPHSRSPLAQDLKLTMGVHCVCVQDVRVQRHVWLQAVRAGESAAWRRRAGAGAAACASGGRAAAQRSLMRGARQAGAGRCDGRRAEEGRTGNPYIPAAQSSSSSILAARKNFTKPASSLSSVEKESAETCTNVGETQEILRKQEGAGTYTRRRAASRPTAGASRARRSRRRRRMS